MHAPRKLVSHLISENYHPRSDKHGKILCLAMLEDLLEACPKLRNKAASGEVVAKINHRQTIGHDEWVIDLAIGQAASAAQRPAPGELIRMEAPAVIQIGIEAKSVMSEHKKARKNRLRDLNAFHSHAHKYADLTIAAGMIVINMAKWFWSPLRMANDITEHRNLETLPKEIVDTYRNIPLRENSTDNPGMEAVGVIVIEHDNLGANPKLPKSAPARRESRLVEVSPAPPVGDPLHYATMIRRICNAYTQRF
jgi:hypothetical protein